MTPTTPEQAMFIAGFVSTTPAASNAIYSLASQIEALTKERDALEENHKECVRCLGEALQDTTNLAIDRDVLALGIDQWKVDFHELSLERDALATAAARYQFMKSRSRVLGLNMNGNHSWTCQITGRDIVGPTLDDAISEAMRQVGVL